MHMNWSDNVLELLLPEGLVLINEQMSIEVTGAGKGRQRKVGGSGAEVIE